MAKAEEIKDFLGNILRSGDEVVILEKETCASGLKNARLLRGVYLDESPWGSEFHIPSRDYRGQMSILRTRLPQERVIKIIIKQED